MRIKSNASLPAIRAAEKEDETFYRISHAKDHNDWRPSNVMQGSLNVVVRGHNSRMARC